MADVEVEVLVHLNVKVMCADDEVDDVEMLGKAAVAKAIAAAKQGPREFDDLIALVYVH
jgi:hypothetical protein